MKKLSIIIPVYNTIEYLERCLDSVSSLKHDIDIILIDDGSTDGSGQLCDNYADRDKRFKVIHMQNQGLVLARKCGMDVVKTDFFTFIDSDDYIDPETYDIMLDVIFEKNIQNADIVCTGMTEEYLGKCYSKINVFNEGIYTGSELTDIHRNMLSKGAFFNFGILPNAVCKIYKSSFVRLNPVSISSNVTVGEDADMTYQLLVKAGTIQILNLVPYHYCRRQDSMMWKKISTKAIDSLELDLKKAFAKYDNDKRELLNQLKDYIDFVSLLCNPKRVLNNDTFFKSKTDRIALYGAGGVGKAVRFGMDNEFTLWVDKNITNNDLKIFPVDNLISKKNCYDKVFIAHSNTLVCKEIKKTLITLGVDKPIYYFRENA